MSTGPSHGEPSIPASSGLGSQSEVSQVRT